MGRLNRQRLRQRNMEFEFGSWNVRTLNKPGGQRNLLSELTRYKIRIAAIQETKWLGSEIRDTKTHTILQSGKTHGSKELGVAFIVDKGIKANILDFQPVNERMCKLRIAAKFFNITIINVHCPTEDKELEEKETFYQKLEDIYNQAPRNDIKIIIGDMNAKVGKEQEFMGTIGRHSLHNTTNENGMLLIDFAASKNMIISSTCFPHRDIHKATWLSPDGRTANQIDHVIVDKRAVTSVMDVRARRGSVCESDHYLVQVKFRCRLNRQSAGKHQGTEKLNLRNLESPEIKERLKKELDKELGAETESSVDGKWERIKKTTWEVAKRVLGTEEKQRKEHWYDEQCKQAVDMRNELYRRYIQRRTRERREKYEEARREADKICRQKKRKYENDRILKMEENLERNNSREAYKYLKYLRGGYKPRTNLCRNDEGQIVSDSATIKFTWRNYFLHLLGEQPDDNANKTGTEHLNQNQESELEDTPHPTLDEVVMAIEEMRKNKAPGIDGIPADIFKEGGHPHTDVYKRQIQFFKKV